MLWNAENRSVSIGDTPLYYVKFGKGKKVIVILPGLSDGITGVKGKALLLAPFYRLFFKEYTVYMFSRKDRISDGYSIRDMARDQAEAINEIGISKAMVIGVSEGGMIAQYLAIDYPQLVERLVLAVTASCVNPMIVEMLSEWEEKLEKNDHKGFMISTAEKSYSKKYLEKYKRIYPFLSLVGKRKSYQRLFVNINAIRGFDASDEIGKISCRTLIIAGDDDRIVGLDASLFMHERIADSQLYVYKGLGHALYEEARDFNSRIFDFFES